MHFPEGSPSSGRHQWSRVQKAEGPAAGGQCPLPVCSAGVGGNGSRRGGCALNAKCGRAGLAPSSSHGCVCPSSSRPSGSHASESVGPPCVNPDAPRRAAARTSTPTPRAPTWGPAAPSPPAVPPLMTLLTRNLVRAHTADGETESALAEPSPGGTGGHSGAAPGRALEPGPPMASEPGQRADVPLGAGPPGVTEPPLSLDRWEGRWVTAWEKGPRDHPILSPRPEPPAAALSELRPTGAPATVPAAWLLRPVTS